MKEIKNIILNTSEESLEKILSPFIEEQFPLFIRTDYRKLVLLVKAYYEWLDSIGKPSYVIGNLQTVSDIDSNAQEFYEHFKNTYLVSFPEKFAVNTSGNKPNKTILLKKIRDFYGNKGTESAYRFLFKILYDSDVEIYYPEKDILKVSGGVWIEPKTIKTTSTNGSALFSYIGGEIRQYDGDNLVGQAFIDNVIQYKFYGYDITEVFLKNIVGDFSPNKTVVYSNKSDTVQETTYSVLGRFFIELPGTDYRVGDSAVVIDSSGVGYSAKVEQISLSGGIKKLSILNSGLNYTQSVVLDVFNQKGVKNSLVFAVSSAITEYPGYFLGNSGKISSNKRIQDRDYYQPYSYSLRSRVPFDTYFETLKQIVHPAGTKMFGSVLVNTALENSISASTQSTVSQKPIIGQYTPYSPRSFNNLRSGYFLPNQVRGATLQVWLSAYNISGPTNNGVTVGVEAVLSRNSGWGIRYWNSLHNGVTFEVATTAITDIWLTPQYVPNAVNTHPSVKIRPFAESGSNTNLRSTGFMSGLTVGALGLTSDRSYFIVCKPNSVGTIGDIGSIYSESQQVLVGDFGGWHGILLGKTGPNDPSLKALCYNYASSTNRPFVVAGIGGTGEWKLLCNTYRKNGTSPGPLSLFLNGVCLGTFELAGSPQSAGIFSSPGLSLGIGCASTSITRQFDGEIAEVVLYQGDVGESDRQKIEGYLAHKYGLAYKLPSNHPHKTSPPGASFSDGKWYGATGDFYPLGYNPYIGSTSAVGSDGTTAPNGSLFINKYSGYTYTVANELGKTAHNPTGSPLGGITAWRAKRETNPNIGNISGMVLWLKPENIGVCGSVVNGASVDVWRDASPSGNDALPPTWDRWNNTLTTTYTGPAVGEWSKQVCQDSAVSTPITRLQFAFNGVCGGFTTGRLMMVGLNTDPNTNAGYQSIDYAFYSFGPHSSGTNLTWGRRIIAYESGVSKSDITPSAGTNYSAFDTSVFEIEYKEPDIIYRINGVQKRRVYSGYGKTYYMDSSFYGDGNSTRIGHSLTVLGMWNGDTPVRPSAAGITTTAGLTTVVYSGVTVDKLRPTLQTAAYGGVTGVSFNGGVLYSARTTYAGKTLGGLMGLGYTTGPGSSAASILTAQHLYLKKPLNFSDEMDVFMVMKSTSDSPNNGMGLFSRLDSLSPSFSATEPIQDDSVLFNRSYNSVDRIAANQTSGFYSVTPLGTLLYPKRTGLVGFRPDGGRPEEQKTTISYDPHVSGACMGLVIGEWTRDSNNQIQTYLNGDASLNRSLITGRRIISTGAPSGEQYSMASGLMFNFDPGKSASVGGFASAKSANLLDPYPFRETPVNIIGPIAPTMWQGDGAGFIADGVTLGDAADKELGGDPVHRFTTGAQYNVYLNRYTGGGAAANAWVDTTTKSTTWTASFTIRREDGVAIPNSIGVYLYDPVSGPTFADGKYPPANSSTVEPLGGGWYRVTRTRTVASPICPNNLIGLTGLVPNTAYRIGRVFLQPYPAGTDVDIPGTTIRSHNSYLNGYSIRDYIGGGSLGTPNSNEIGYKTGPSGKPETVWHGKAHLHGDYMSDAGFVSPEVPIDPTKMYRYSVWINRAVLNNGAVYFGPGTTATSGGLPIIRRSDGVLDINSYFDFQRQSHLAWSGKQNKWVLVVGHVHPVGSGTGPNHSNSGYYLPNTGTTYTGFLTGNLHGDKVWTSTNARSSIRTFLYQCNNRGEEVQFARPRIEVIDGTELSIEALTSSSINTVYDLSNSSATSSATMEVINEVGYTPDGGGSVVFTGGPGVISKNTPLVFGTNRNITWEAWVKPSVLYETDMYMGGGSLPYFGNYYTAFLWSVYHPNNTQILIKSNLGFFVANTWHHVVCVSEYDGTTTRYTVYKNGVKITTTGTVNDTSVVISPDTSTIGISGKEQLGSSNDGNVEFYIANRASGKRFNNNGTNTFWRGSVSNTRVYSRALNQAEVQQNFNALRSRFGL